MMVEIALFCVFIEFVNYTRSYITTKGITGAVIVTVGTEIPFDGRVNVAVVVTVDVAIEPVHEFTHLDGTGGSVVPNDCCVRVAVFVIVEMANDSFIEGRLRTQVNPRREKVGPFGFSVISTCALMISLRCSCRRLLPFSPKRYVAVKLIGILASRWTGKKWSSQKKSAKD